LAAYAAMDFDALPQLLGCTRCTLDQLLGLLPLQWRVELVRSMHSLGIALPGAGEEAPSFRVRLHVNLVRAHPHLTDDRESHMVWVQRNHLNPDFLPRYIEYMKPGSMCIELNVMHHAFGFNTVQLAETHCLEFTEKVQLNGVTFKGMCRVPASHA
jgi:hypothetical protein